MAQSLARQVWELMKERKKWWLLPIVIMLVIVGLFVILGSSSAISPFIYALF